MSLAVWLPLNGSLENQGYSTVQVTNNGATIDDNGKIGKCYSFDGTNDYMVGTYTPTTNISFCCWVYFPTAPNGKHIFDARNTVGNSGYQPMFINTSSIQIGGSGSSYVSFSYTWATNTWYHICVTHNSTKGSFYVNGNLINSSTSAKGFNAPECNFTLGSRCNQGNYSNVKLNDVRIYDHCLSPLEVKEIAQGLVLHYKLDGNGWGNSNLILESHKITGGGNASGITRTYMDDGSMKIVAASSNGNWASINFNKNSNDNVRANLVVGDTYTISCDIKVEEGTKLPTLFINSGNGYKQLQGTIQLNKWIRAYYTSTWAEPGTGYGNISLHLGFSNAIGTYYFKNFKLEKGSKSTPWCPNEADELYKTMGLNDGIIYDSSGYNNNGTIINTPTISSDTPRYNNCLHISAVNQKVQINNIITSGFGNSYTIAWWGKCATFSGTMHWGFSDGVRLNGIFNGNLWNTGDSGQNPLYKPGTTTQVTAPSTGVWHHFAMTGDGTNCKVYLDGEYWGIAKTYKSISGTSIYLNGWNSSTSYSNSDLSLSDFRVYCTALSATDIKLLYSAGARADNLGGLHVQEFEESARKGITTQRILHSSNFFESGYLELLHYDKNVYTEPDGTTWVHIFHHNDPTNNGLFASTDSFETSVYKNEHKWYDIEPLMANMPMYEFLVVQKTTSSATETKYRWIQNVNPLEATYNDVKPGTVTVNTSSEYTSNSMGGLYKNIRNNARLSIANTNSQNWFGALGSWTSYQNGVPGFPETTITTGYLDLYVRIYTPIKFIKDTGTNALNFIEI